jgi:Protein of unknown function (DUF4232)
MNHMLSRLHRLGACVSLVVVAVLFAGCSSGTPAATSTTTTTTTTTTPPTSTTSSTAPTLAACTTAQLSVTAGLNSGAAGTIGQVVLFQNTGTTTCLLHAFPGVAGLNSSGVQIVQATREVNLAPFSGSTASLPTIQLTPGSTGSALVLGSDVPEGAATSCVTYAALLITPPNAFQSVKLDVSLPGCSGLRVGPVYPGTTGMASS